jgi:S-adenosylmethionine hydrolase
MTIITLTTDFGVTDGYVGAMKGVILSLAPNVTLIDISHAVNPHDIRHGARILATAAPEFPEGTIHVAVVDPGVGSSRRGMALRTANAFFVGPDNGLFSPFLSSKVVCVELTKGATHRLHVSHTFHGRDVFAPVAAHLANGMSINDLGPPLIDPIWLVEPEPAHSDGGWLVGEVVYVDRFGNLVTNVGPLYTERLESAGARVVVDDIRIPFVRTYSDVAVGELLALIGSSGYLEIAVRTGRASDFVGTGIGTVVKVWGI